MNLTEDPLRVVADLRPADHDRLADEAYERNRAADLARAMGESGATTRHEGSPRAHKYPATPGPRRAGVGLVAAAVAAAVVMTVPSPTWSFAAGCIKRCHWPGGQRWH